MAQFTRFLRHGQTLFGTSDPNTIAGYDAAKKQLVFVTVNYAAPQPIVYDLSNVTGVGVEAKVTVTNTGGGKMFETRPIKVKRGRITIEAGANSIYSLVVPVERVR
jgi:hypothetical protein